jgi:two-component system response regulator AlgR
MPIRTLIVDDEPLAIERLQILCARLPEVQLIGTASDGEAAVRMVEALSPELLLLDIAMPGMTGLEVAERLAGRAPRPLIIFVTAFDQFAVAAFDIDAVDYLLKPVEPDRLARAIQRIAERRAGPAPDAGQDENGGETAPMRLLPGNGAAAGNGGHRASGPLREFWIPNRGELVRVSASEIEWIEAERDYMRLHLPGRSCLILETISALEAKLDPAQFLRVHRGAIVQREAVRRLTHDGQGNWAAELRSGAVVRIGRTYLAAARTAFLGER